MWTGVKVLFLNSHGQIFILGGSNHGSGLGFIRSKLLSPEVTHRGEWRGGGLFGGMGGTKILPSVL